MCSDKPAISPRKQAQQDRSRQKVEQILQAALELLSERPSHQVNTSVIAERAQVSVGTLYQFYPNKEAIYYELFSRWLSETLGKLDEVRDSLPEDASKQDCIEAFLTALTEPGLNSQQNWKLRWAMTSSSDLIELEARHKREVLTRVHDLQGRFGGRPPARIEPEVMMLQNEVTIACLFSLSLFQNSNNQATLFQLCRKLLQVIYDFPRWEGLDQDG